MSDYNYLLHDSDLEEEQHVEPEEEHNRRWLNGEQCLEEDCRHPHPTIQIFPVWQFRDRVSKDTTLIIPDTVTFGLEQIVDDPRFEYKGNNEYQSNSGWGVKRVKEVLFGEFGVSDQCIDDFSVQQERWNVQRRKDSADRSRVNRKQLVADYRDSNLMNFGEHKTKTYAYVERSNPSYCTWAKATIAKNKSSGRARSGPLGLFAAYLERKPSSSSSSSSPDSRSKLKRNRSDTTNEQRTPKRKRKSKTSRS